MKRDAANFANDETDFIISKLPSTVSPLIFVPTKIKVVACMLCFVFHEIKCCWFFCRSKSLKMRKVLMIVSHCSINVWTLRT